MSEDRKVCLQAAFASRSFSLRHRLVGIGVLGGLGKDKSRASPAFINSLRHKRLAADFLAQSIARNRKYRSNNFFRNLSLGGD
jgi:hypothetical protein